MEWKCFKNRNRTEVANKDMKPVLYEPNIKDFENNGGIATLADCRSLKVTEEANGSYIAELTFPITTKYSEYLEDVNYQIKCKPNDLDNYHVFYIYTHYKDMATGLLYVTAKSRTMKLGNRTVKNVVIDNQTGIQAMALLHDGMDLESDIKMFSDITTISSTSFEVSNPLECIKGIDGSLNQRYGGEIKHEPNRISLLKRRGKDNVTTIRYRKNLEGFKLELNWDGLVTRIFPYADVQNSDGKTERIYGNKVDSQYIGNYDGEVYARHIQFTEDQGVTDTNSLNKVASKYFTSMNSGIDKPKVSAEVNVRKLDNHVKFKNFRQLGIFDSFTVFHERYNINLEMTVNKVVYDGLLEQIESLEAGDPKFTFFEEQQNQFTEVMKKVPTKQYNSVFIDYVTQIISGNDGGNVIWWPKERPTDLFFVDGETLEDSKRVLRINKSGIGFSSTGWKGPFKTAWTLDGTFVADFITAGTLQGVKIRSINDDFIIELYDGKIRFIKKAGSSEKEMFAFAPTYVDGQLQGINAIQNQGYSFALSSMGNNGAFLNVLEIPKDSTADNRKLKLYGEVSVDGSLSINGEKVIPGQNGGGGGGGTGGYPPEVTTDADKFAWDAWSWLINNGYSKQAAAGILGNIQGEVGSTMNPDTEQVGGPGYGAVQFDGSAYPLVGSPTWDGREYVQRLMAAAGIKSDYKTMEAQIRLINWCMYNGQWIGAVDPTSVEGFKNSTDPKQAAYAFEKNFERPATAHSERQGYAQAWYDKFKDLKPSQNTGEKGLEHLKSILGQRIGNGQCYGLSAEYSGFLGGCGLGAGTQYGLSHVSGNGSTSAAADIGIAYNWSEVGWKVIKNPAYKDLVVGAIMNYARGGHVGSWYADDTYGHTGIIRGLENGKIQTYEQNTEKGQICAELERDYYSPSDISSICIPPK